MEGRKQLVKLPTLHFPQRDLSVTLLIRNVLFRAYRRIRSGQPFIL
jgi:hypothetical protein